MFLTRRNFKWGLRDKLIAYITSPLKPFIGRFKSCCRKYDSFKQLMRDTRRKEKAIQRLLRDFDIVRLICKVRENSQNA
jgi:hypothetical protein